MLVSMVQVRPVRMAVDSLGMSVRVRMLRPCMSRLAVLMVVMIVIMQMRMYVLQLCMVMLVLVPINEHCCDRQGQQ